MKFREAEIKDLDQLEALEKICFKNEPWTKQMLEDSLHDLQMIFIVAEDDYIVAYALMLVIPGIESQLCSIAVMPEYRRSGIAKKLLQILYDEAKSLNINEMTLEVRVSNINAQKLYENMGFVNEGIRPGYYQNGEDAIIMWNHNIDN